MYRTHTCGELRIEHVGQEVTLAGWVAAVRDFGPLTFIDLRDRYGITQLVFDMQTNPELCESARRIGREWVIQARGKVRERSNKNPNRATGDIEIEVHQLRVLNPSKIPPFTIETHTDGGEELRMKYRYLDIRRDPVKEKLLFRARLAMETRLYLSSQGFVEIETPYLIKSTPEGARDFVVPSRLHPGQFYALPQSPQTFKQILMVAGMDKYFQIVKCFRDEDLRADRQPEFTQIDCEMSFVEREDVLQTFEGLICHLYKSLLDIELGPFPRMTYEEAMTKYGTDKPDLRFDMVIHDISEHAKGMGFQVFDSAEIVAGLCVPQRANDFTNRIIKELTAWVQRPQIGAKGLVYIKWNADDTTKSSIGKFFDDETLRSWLAHMDARPGDIAFLLAGKKGETLRQLSELRLELAHRLELIPDDTVKPVWIVDFPLLEWDEDEQRFHAMHHPFTAPRDEDLPLLDSADHSDHLRIKANAYDLVINGAEIGGGSIRIHDRTVQMKMFRLLGFSPEEVEAQFGFLLHAFEYGAPPHGGIAFGLDRLCAIMQNQKSIRDYIAFPKNNQGRDIMIDAPAPLEPHQLEELHLCIRNNAQD